MSDPPGQPPERRPSLRASDADRERVVDILRQAAGEGRLVVEELDEGGHDVRLEIRQGARGRSWIERRGDQRRLHRSGPGAHGLR